MVNITHHGKKNKTTDKKINVVKKIKPIQSVIIEDMFPGPIVLILDKKYLCEVRNRNDKRKYPIFFREELAELIRTKTRKNELGIVYKAKLKFGGWILPNAKEVDFDA